jgi:hypothetical protein
MAKRKVTPRKPAPAKPNKVAKLSKAAQKKATIKNPAPKTPGNGKKKVDWEKAKRWYLDDATRSYADVAKQFGVTKRTVELQSKKGDTTWTTLRQDLGETQTANFVSEKQKDLDDTNEQHRKLYQAMQRAGARALSMLTPEIDEATNKVKKGGTVDARGMQAAANTIKAGIEGERVILGLPIIISKSETAIQDYTPPSAAEASKKISKWTERQARLNAMAAADTAATDASRA